MTGRAIGPSGAKHNKKKIPDLSSEERDSHIKVSHMRHTTRKDRLDR